MTRMLELNIDMITITVDGDDVDIAYRFVAQADDIKGPQFEASSREFIAGTKTHTALTELDERLEAALSASVSVPPPTPTPKGDKVTNETTGNRSVHISAGGNRSSDRHMGVAPAADQEPR
jgi:hypothetical protein